MRNRTDLADLLNTSGLLGYGVEVGVREGRFSNRLLTEWRGRQLVMVDAWSTDLPHLNDSVGTISERKMTAWKAAAEKVAGRFGDRVCVMQALSLDAAAEFPSGFLDFVYLDANHGYDPEGQWGIVADLAAWWPKLREGGVFAGHDYFLARRKRNGAPEFVECEQDAELEIYGVEKAVDEFAAKLGVEVLTTTHDLCASWWWVKQ